jgi:hypothetical protein
MEKDFEGKKRKPEQDVTSIDELKKKGKNKKKGKKERKPRANNIKGEQNEENIRQKNDKWGEKAVLESQKFEFYYKVFILNYLIDSTCSIF